MKPRTRSDLEQAAHGVLVEGTVCLAFAWLPMLALGVFHSAQPAVPAWGYWECVVLLAVMRMVAFLFRPRRLS